jgi:hypothetical protein
MLITETIPMQKKDSESSVKSMKAQAFDWVFKALIGVVLWVVADMHGDLKEVLKVIPVIRLQIDYLKDDQLKDRLKAIPPVPAKHEDHITYDSLINNK